MAIQYSKEENDAIHGHAFVLISNPRVEGGMHLKSLRPWKPSLPIVSNKGPGKCVASQDHTLENGQPLIPYSEAWNSLVCPLHPDSSSQK